MIRDWCSNIFGRNLHITTLIVAKRDLVINLFADNFALFFF